jgi:hypothetical protein
MGSAKASLRRRYRLYAAVTAVPMAQVGHVLSYTARYGGAATTIQRSGAHAYFPEFFKAGVGVLAGAMLAGLLVIGAGRLLLARNLGYRRRPGIPIPDLIVACLCFQFDVYLVQEVLEALGSGQVLTMQLLATVAVFGLVGQGPVALLAALALHWLSTRLELVLRQLHCTLDRRVTNRPPVLAAVPVPPAPSGVRLLQQISRAACPTRGPPAVR